MKAWAWERHRSGLVGVLALLVPLALALRCSGADEMRGQARDAVVGRTVAVRSPLTQQSAASGFVWGRKGSTTYVVTVLNVGLLVGTRYTTAHQELEVVAWPGTDRETTTQGEVVAYDTSSGLAVLAVKGDMPSPIPCMSTAVMIGTTVHIATAPIKPDRSRLDKQLPVSVTPSRIASIRVSEDFSLLQLDGDVPPGGEGGPVVSPDGQVAGVAFGRWGNTLVSFAIPVAYLRRFLSGSPASPVVRPHGAKLEFSVSLLDLARKVESCSFHVLPEKAVEKPAPGPNGEWALLAPDMMSFAAKPAYPTVFLDLPILETELASGKYWIQARTVLADGTSLVSNPVLFACERPAPQGPPLPQAAKPSADGDIEGVEITRGVKDPNLFLSSCSFRRVNDSDLTGFVLQTPNEAKKRVDLGANQAVTIPMHHAAWGPDGEILYTLSKSELPGCSTQIARFARPPGYPRAWAAFSQPVAEIHRTHVGLVAVVANRGLVLLDRDSLEPKARLSVPGISELHVPLAGDYAVAVTRTEPQTGGIEWGTGLRVQGDIAALHVVDLSHWREDYVYRGKSQPLPTVSLRAIDLGVRFDGTIGLADDGEWLLCTTTTDAGRETRIYPWQQGRLNAGACTSVPLAATAFRPVSGYASVLVSLPYQKWTPQNPRPEGAPEEGSASCLVMNPGRPKLDGKRFWATAQAAAADHVFLFNDADHTFRSLKRNGEEELATAMPTIQGWATSCREIIAAPCVPSVLMAWDRLWYILEPHRRGPDEPIPEKIKSSTEERSLPVETGQALSLRWKQTLLPELTGPYQALTAERDAILVANRTGMIWRIDLDRGVLTASAQQEIDYCSGMALTRCGLVIAVRTKVAGGRQVQELQLRDSATLEIRNRWPLEQPPTAMASSPVTDFVVMAIYERGLHIFDCKAGTLTPAKLPPIPDAPPRPPDVFLASATGSSMVLSSDGRRLFVATGNRVLRYGLEDGRFTPGAASEYVLQTPTSPTVDEDGTYVGVLTSHPTQIPAGWGAAPVEQIRRSGTEAPGLTVLDANTLRPVYHVSVQPCAFLFDKANSQIVTRSWQRCLPNGTVVPGLPAAALHGTIVPGLPADTLPPWGGEQLFHGKDGWLVSATDGGILQVRFAAAAIPAQWWGGR